MYGPFKPILSTEYLTVEKANALSTLQHPYYRVTGHDSVICCILNHDDQFVMVRQFRPNLEFSTLETPAGGEPP